MVWHDIYYMIRYGNMWLGVVLYGMIWFGMVYNMIWWDK